MEIKKPTTFIYGILIGLIGIVLFSSKAVMVKLAYQYDVDAISILFLRMLFSFPFYLAVVFWNRKKTADAVLKTKDYYWLIFFGVVGYYLSSYFDFVGLQYIKASLERIILFLYPTIIIILNRVFLKKTITSKQLLAIGITYVGVVITFWGEVVVSGSNVYLGGFLILLCAITYAAYLVGSGWLIPKFGVVKFTSYAMIVSCVCVFLHYLIMNETSIFSFTWEVYLLGLLIAIFATVIPSFLVSISIKMIDSSNFAIVAGAGPVSTIILAGIFLGEQLTWLQLFGALVVIFGILLVSLKKVKI
ncbi:DMT family transporter [Confluentibacter lentus]|uniref:DMT family transporter n=1 Tax=Confluentibacter lentus TaxID=1699412 RepID=UPI000C283F9D|nr:DMT family transporter [Confluentibacter lentus]